ncbi:MAG: class I SAM-dependent methyltransferase, partial [Gammaproteobacteria bacterium]|nr:class I SAM-dependent methyltransferase [Gammaproteobacteria bacterium]
MENNMSEHWSEYWSHGHMTSFSEEFKNNYEGELLNIWKPFIQQIKNGEKMLDICTGNGALLLIADEHINDTSSVKLVGVDFADVLPVLERKRIQILPNINIHKLPFTNQSIDYVTSQFGIEYSDIKSSLKEVSRVLKPGAKLQFVMHHKDSLIIKLNKTILSCYQAINSDDGVLNILSSMIAELEIASVGRENITGNQKTETLRQQLNENNQKLLNIDKEALYQTQFPSLVQQVFDPKNNFSKKRELIENIHKIESSFNECLMYSGDEKKRDEFLTNFDTIYKKTRKDYISVIKSLDEHSLEIGTSWLSSIVEN